jgi:hypothetical protein
MSQTTAQLISNLVQALAFESTSAAPDNGVYLSAANTLAFNTNAAASPRLTIDSDGKLLVGTSSSISGANLQVVDTTSCALVLARNDTSIVEGNSIGEIRFFNNDSTSYEECANIAAVADGTYADGDKPTRLVFSTTADGGSSPTEKMRISANGNLTVDTDTFFVDAVNDRVGVGTTSPTATLHIAGGTARPALYMFGSDKDIGYNSVLQFGEWDGTTYTERMRIDSSGRLLVGTISDITADVSSILQGVHASGGALNLARNDSSVSTNNTIGRIRFWGNAENGTWQECAQIIARADGTHGNSDKPTRLEFRTTAAGAASPTERMRIENNGNILFNFDGTSQSGVARFADGTQSSPGITFWADGSADTGIYRPGANTLGFTTGGAEAARIDSDGRLLVGTNSAFGGNAELLQIARNGGGGIALLRNDLTVSSGNELGAISWYGNDSTGTTVEECATIRAFADGDHADGDKPTRLVFSTTADGESSPTERMTIKADGNVGINTVDPRAIFTTRAGGFDPTDNEVFDGVGLFLESTAAQADGNYGSALAWSRPGTNNRFKCAIAPVQEGSDTDVQGLAFFTSNGTLAADDPAERARIDSDGRLLVGTNSNFTRGSLQVIDGGGGEITIGRNDTTVSAGNDLGHIFFASNDEGTGASSYASISCYADSNHTGSPASAPTRLSFSTTPSTTATAVERMRINNAGNVYFGNDISSTPWNRTSGNSTMSWLEDTGSGGGALAIANNADRTFSALYINKFAYTSGDDDRFADFRLNGGSTIGSITINATSNGVNYNTTSDYRLKENVVALTDGIDRLKQLNVNRFNFIGSTLVVDGFIAHEVQDVVPEAISGAKDAVDNEGNPKYQGIDQSKLVPLLTAALQEAIAKIETLEQRLTDAGIA